MQSSQLFGKLEDSDTQWLCAGGFTTETQIFYTTTSDSTSVMCQVIHSSIGYVYFLGNETRINGWFRVGCGIQPSSSHSRYTIQILRKSINVSNFVSPPPGLDKRSCKADEFSLTYEAHPDSDYPETYTIRASLSTRLQISLTFSRPALIPGFKVGSGPKGGYSYYGPNVDGYVIHHFWPVLSPLVISPITVKL